MNEITRSWNDVLSGFNHVTCHYPGYMLEYILTICIICPYCVYYNSYFNRCWFCNKIYLLIVFLHSVLLYYFFVKYATVNNICK